MAESKTSTATSWWKQVVQNRLTALVLGMIFIVPLVASPADPHVAGTAAFALESFAVLLLAVLLWNARWNLTREQVSSFFRTGPNLAIILFLGMTVISCALSPLKLFSIQETLKLASGILLYFVVAYQFRRSEQLSMMTGTLLALALVASLVGLGQYSYMSAERANAFFGNDQPLGSFLMILLPILVVSALADTSPKRQIVAQVATVLTVGCLLLTQCRSAWMGAAAGLTVVAILSVITMAKKQNLAIQKHKLVLPGMLAVVSLGFFAAVALNVTSIAQRASTLSSISTDRTWHMRQGDFHGAFQMILAKPLTGWGTGLYPVFQHSFTGAGVLINSYNQRITLAEQAHNFYLQTAAELGIPGLCLMLLIVATFLWAALTSLHRVEGGIRRNLLIGSVGATVAFLVDAMSSPSWQYGQISMFLWLMMGIGVGCLLPRIKAHREPQRVQAVARPRLARPMAVISATLLMMMGVSTVGVAGADNGYTSNSDIGEEVLGAGALAFAAYYLFPGTFSSGAGAAGAGASGTGTGAGGASGGGGDMTTGANTPTGGGSAPAPGTPGSGNGNGKNGTINP